MNKNLLGVVFTFLSLSIGMNASATIKYHYERSVGAFGGYSGLSYDTVSASYDTGTDQFVFEVAYDGDTADGGWLVVSPGANPRGDATSELGIAYFDADSGDAWVYAYNGSSSAASYLDSTFLEYFDDAYTTLDGVATLSFDATDINAVLETGFSFGQRVGIWFHPANNVSINGGFEGMESFYASGVGWLDTNIDGNCSNPNNGCITAIPEPSSLALLAAGFGLIGLRKRLTEGGADRG